MPEPTMTLDPKALEAACIAANRAYWRDRTDFDSWITAAIAAYLKAAGIVEVEVIGRTK